MEETFLIHIYILEKLSIYINIFQYYIHYKHDFFLDC